MADAIRVLPWLLLKAVVHSGGRGRFLEVQGQAGSGKTTTVLEVLASLQADAADLAFGHLVCPTARNFYTTLWQVLVSRARLP